VGDQLEGLGEQGQTLADGVVVLDVRLARGGTDYELLALEADALKLSDAGDRDEMRRLREAEVHERDQALPARQDPRVVAQIPQKR
jgi:hypothetical protein